MHLTPVVSRATAHEIAAALTHLHAQYLLYNNLIVSHLGSIKTDNAVAVHLTPSLGHVVAGPAPPPPSPHPPPPPPPPPALVPHPQRACLETCGMGSGRQHMRLLQRCRTCTVRTFYTGTSLAATFCWPAAMPMSAASQPRWQTLASAGLLAQSR